MSKGLFAGVVALLLWTRTGYAQEGPLHACPVTIGAPIPLLGPDSDLPREHTPCDRTPRGRVSLEYLRWWITPGPVGVALVTTGDPASPTAGALGDSSTRILFGDSDIDFGGFNGGRLTAGYWFGCDSRFGIEGSGFLLGERTNRFNAASDTAGNPLLALPFQTIAGVESRALISNPIPPTTPQTGAVAITSTSRLWGADLNAVLNLCRECNFTLDVLGGFRYFDLEESIRLDANTQVRIRIADQLLPLQSVFFDSFETHNRFYGGQLGVRAAYCARRFSAEALFLLALGGTEHSLTIDGSTTTIFNGVAGNPTPGGFYTRPSNLGTFDSSSFSVIPQLQLKLGYNITPSLRATVGYDVLFWPNVNRPGNQIDRVIGPQPGSRPAPLNNHSNLWAHGLSVGLEYRW